MTTEPEMVELEELRAWVDGEIVDPRAAQIQHAVDNSSELTEMVTSLRASQLPYKEAVDAMPLPEVPSGLQQKIDELLDEDETLSKSIQRQPKKLNLMIASLVAATGMIVTAATGYFLGTKNANESMANIATITDNLGFAQSIANYQAFYVRETVEHTRDDNVSQITSRLHDQNTLEIQIPDFSEQGLQFVRAQQLGFSGQPLVQLVYLGKNGLPVALCYMPETGGTSEVTFDNHFGMKTAEWVENDQRFVIVAKLGEADITALYQSAHRQL